VRFGPPCTRVRSPFLRLHQRFGFDCEPSFSPDMSQLGKIRSMGYAAKAGLRRRFSRRVNMIASKHPVKAPRNASVMERLLKVRSPWPVRRNPVYAIVTVQRITRTDCIGSPLPHSRVKEQIHNHVAQHPEPSKRARPSAQTPRRTALSESRSQARYHE
jgi:hypothetical protein